MVSTTSLCFIDTETTGLDARIHQPYEVSWWREEQESPRTLQLPHSLEYADPAALRIGGYHDRGMTPHDYTEKANACRFKLLANLTGVTIVGSNPAFDAAMLTRFIGTPVWHHRMIDVSNVAMVVWDLRAPIGLAEIAGRLGVLGYEIPEPDHTAEGDVRTTRAAYEALREIRSGMQP